MNEITTWYQDNIHNHSESDIQIRNSIKLQDQGFEKNIYNNFTSYDICFQALQPIDKKIKPGLVKRSTEQPALPRRYSNNSKLT